MHVEVSSHVDVMLVKIEQENVLSFGWFDDFQFYLDLIFFYSLHSLNRRCSSRSYCVELGVHLLTYMEACH